MEKDDLIKEHYRIAAKYQSVIDLYDDIILELLQVIKDLNIKNAKLQLAIDMNNRFKEDRNE